MVCIYDIGFERAAACLLPNTPRMPEEGVEPSTKRRFKRRAFTCYTTPARETRDGSRTRDIGFADRRLDHLATRVKKASCENRTRASALATQRPYRLDQRSPMRKEGVEPSRTKVQQGLSLPRFPVTPLPQKLLPYHADERTRTSTGFFPQPSQGCPSAKFQHIRSNAEGEIRTLTTRFLKPVRLPFAPLRQVWA